jgi:biopolymer transport protein ExbD
LKQPFFEVAVWNLLQQASHKKSLSMAEITTGESHNKQRVGVPKTKKLSTRVDLTPMVDLGFLLITFFIFTTSMSKPTTMRLNLPDDRGNATPTKEGGVLTLLPSVNGSVYYYEGNLNKSNLKAASLKEVRDVIIEKKRRTAANDMFVIIKPSKASVYGDIVNVLDEMTINDVKRYALVDITENEQILIK